MKFSPYSLKVLNNSQCWRACVFNLRWQVDHLELLFGLLCKYKYNTSMLRKLLQIPPLRSRCQCSWKKKELFNTSWSKPWTMDDRTYQTNAGSGNCKTMINPNATKIKARFTNMSKQQTPLVLGQNWKKSDSKEFVINLMLENFFCFKNWVWYGLKRNNRPMMSHSKIILFVNSFL